MQAQRCPSADIEMWSLGRQTGNETIYLKKGMQRNESLCDYQNRRADYVSAVLDKLINWDFALQNAG